jgi:hypothetical protein
LIGVPEEPGAGPARRSSTVDAPTVDGTATAMSIEPVDQLVLPPLRPSARWYVLAVAVIVLGLGGGFALLTSGAFGYLNDVDDLARIAIPGRAETSLPAGEVLVYHEPGAGPVVGLDDLAFEARAADGRVVEVRDAAGEDRYLIEGRRGFSIAALTVPDAGAYEIEVSGRATGEVAVGRSPRERLTLFGWLAIGVSVVSLVIGIVLLLATRGRRRRALAARLLEQQARRVSRLG